MKLKKRRPATGDGVGLFENKVSRYLLFCAGQGWRSVVDTAGELLVEHIEGETVVTDELEAVDERLCRFLFLHLLGNEPVELAACGIVVLSLGKSINIVDESCHLLLIYEGGKAAFVSGAFNQSSTPEVEIVGDKGRIIIGPEMWHPRKAELIYNDGTKELTEDDYPASGFQYEIQAVQECLKNGEKECKHFTHEESRKIGGLIEETRKVWGIVYAADEQQ